MGDKQKEGGGEGCRQKRPRAPANDSLGLGLGWVVWSISTTESVPWGDRRGKRWSSWIEERDKSTSYVRKQEKEKLLFCVVYFADVTEVSIKLTTKAVLPCTCRLTLVLRTMTPRSTWTWRTRRPCVSRSPSPKRERSCEEWMSIGCCTRLWASDSCGNSQKYQESNKRYGSLHPCTLILLDTEPKKLVLVGCWLVHRNGLS